MCKCVVGWGPGELLVGVVGDVWVLGGCGGGWGGLEGGKVAAWERWWVEGGLGGWEGKPPISSSLFPCGIQSSTSPPARNL